MNLKENNVELSSLEDFGKGLTFGKENQLKVIGSERVGYNLFYYLTCEFCSCDAELFGEGIFKANAAKLNQGVIPCGCSKYPKWSEKQTMIRVRRACDAQNYKLLGLESPFNGSRTEICISNGTEEWVVTINALLKGTLSRKEAIIKSGISRRKEDSYYIDKLKLIFPENTEFERCKDKPSRWIVYCPVCETTNSSNITSLLKGSKPCPCSGVYKWTEEQNIERVLKVAKDKNYEFLGLVGEYKGIKSKIKLSSENGEWVTNLDLFVNKGSGCPVQGAKDNGKARSKSVDEWISTFRSTGKYNLLTTFELTERPRFWLVKCGKCGEVSETHLTTLSKGSISCSCLYDKMTKCYVHIVYDQGSEVAIKFGRTTDTKRRLQTQRTFSKLKLENYGEWEFENKNDAVKAESMCRKSFLCGIVERQLMSDGWSETTSIANLEEVIRIYESFGGIKT